ncbi:MAG: hypothetical protein ACLFNK_00305 [Candidatus Woesearchaeota archaeon]
MQGGIRGQILLLVTLLVSGIVAVIRFPGIVWIYRRQEYAKNIKKDRIEKSIYLE